jgi:hypothetical protein
MSKNSKYAEYKNMCVVNWWTGSLTGGHLWKCPYIDTFGVITTGSNWNSVYYQTIVNVVTDLNWAINILKRRKYRWPPVSDPVHQFTTHIILWITGYVMEKHKQWLNYCKYLLDTKINIGTVKHIPITCQFQFQNE